MEVIFRLGIGCGRQTIGLAVWAVLTMTVLITDCVAQDVEEVDNSKYDQYRQKFGVDCLLEKITDNTGEGFEELYGTRNCRVVLHGVAYRGGGNNYYHRVNKRSNKNPLPMDGLENLLLNGFSSSIYLYSENFESAPLFLTNEEQDTLNYYQIGGNNEQEVDSILKMTYEAITDQKIGPIYFHCWNGWHQSGFVSAILLKQFCGFDSESSLNYWVAGADNLSKGYDKIKVAIRNFEPVEKYKITEQVSKEICPCFEQSEEVDKVVSQREEPKILMGSVLFPANVTVLPPVVSTFLDEQVKILIENTTFSVEIQGHSDSKGTKMSNRKLSEQRARNVYEYMVSQGVDSLRLSYKGFGEKKLTNECSDGKSCPEELHALNRRVELKVSGISAQLKFAENTAEISQHDKEVIIDIKSVLLSDATLKLEIAGHSDGTTDSLANEIAELRAQTVFRFLKDSGVSESQMSYLGFGSNNSVFNDFRDRRVDFKILRCE